MKITSLFFICVFVFLSACKQVEPAFDVTKLNGFPADIDGCTCYFSESETELKNDGYLFVSDFADLAYISIDSQSIQLKLIKTTREANTIVDTNFAVEYSNGIYDVTITVKSVKEAGYETSQVRGEMSVKDKNNQVITKKFVGECGC